MMATLFIGKQDWVFRLKEHIQWIVGICVGVVLTITSMFIYISYFKANKDALYSVVNMNEIKAKAID